MTNNEIFKAIESACLIETAVRLANISLRKSARGRPLTHPTPGPYISPFREDKNPSFTLWRHQKSDHWLWADKATGDKGNVIHLVAKGRGITYAEAAELIDDHLCLGHWTKAKLKNSKVFKSREFKNIDIRPLELLTISEIATGLSLNSAEGVRFLVNRGLLHTGDYWNKGNPRDFKQTDCWFLLDATTMGGTARRISGDYIGRQKSSVPKGWRKWPIGISSYDSKVHTLAVIAEGEKDLCAILSGDFGAATLPICMPSVTTTIQGVEFPKLEQAIIFAQGDLEGIEAAMRWANWVDGSAKNVEVWVPKKKGDDWADLLRDKESEQVVEAMNLKHEFVVYSAEAIQHLNPDDFPPAKDHKRKAKQRGSVVNYQRIEDILAVQQKLPSDRRESPTHIARAMRLQPTGTNRKKISRSLKLIERLGLGSEIVKCEKVEKVENVECESGRGSLDAVEVKQPYCRSEHDAFTSH